MKTCWLLRRALYHSDVAEAFTRLGWQAEMKSELEMCIAMSKGERPDLILTNIGVWSLAQAKAGLPEGHFTLFQVAEKCKVPTCWWLLDSWNLSPDLLNYEQQDGAVKVGLPRIEPWITPPPSPYLFTFTVNKDHLHRLPKPAMVLPFGVNELRFKSMPDVPKAHDVGFVGTSLVASPNDGYYDYEAAGLMNEDGSLKDVDFGDEPTRRTWEIRRGTRESAIARIEACVKAKASVWGDGWDQVPVKRCGYADWATDLPTVLNSCKVGLNVSKVHFKHDLAPRLFELLACEVPVVSNKLPGIEAEIGRYIWFYGDDDIEQMVKAAAMGTAMPKLGRQWILDGQTWVHRVSTILEVIGV